MMAEFFGVLFCPLPLHPGGCAWHLEEWHSVNLKHPQHGSEAGNCGGSDSNSVSKTETRVLNSKPKILGFHMSG
jgi:hypothetical protein